MKKAFDWIAGSGNFPASPRAGERVGARRAAQASLREVLKIIEARLLSEVAVTIDLMAKKLTAVEIAADVWFAGRLRKSPGSTSCAIMEA